MKKVLSITMSIFMLISMFVFCASAKNPTYGDFEYKVTKDGTVTIVKYHGKDETVKIPSKINGQKVTVIGKEAFLINFYIKEVKLPKTLKVISESAFECCLNLKSITIPNSVTTIESFAFAECEELSYVKLGKNITKIGSGILGETPYNYNLDETGCLYVDNYLIGVYDETTFKESIKNNTFKIKEGTVLIADYAMAFSSKAFDVKKIVLPDSLKYIGEHTFANHKSLETVKFGKNVISIGKEAFYECPNLKNIKIPASVKTIEDYAFGYTYNYKKKKRVIVKGVTITGYANTAAEKYANKNGIEFKF